MKTATLFALVTLLPALAAQDKPPAAKPFVLEAGEIKLTEFVDRCAGYLQWNVLSNAPELASCPMQEIRTQNRIEVDHDGCVELLSSMLARGNFVLTVLDEDKHLYEIIAANGPRNREIVNRAVRRTPEEILARPTLRMPVTTVLELKHTNSTIAVNALRPFFASAGSAGSPSLTIGNMGNTSTVMLSGLQDQVATAIGMVRTGDVPMPAEAETGDLGRIEAIERRLAVIEKRLKALEKGEER
ncbi:MAG: hypothetical protein JNM25_11025 [Planctomycetes bacterium]|nr:hypothetical protein [Planctomycetota bacterium]